MYQLPRKFRFVAERIELARQATLDAEPRMMLWFGTWRCQPRDGRGKFLSKLWLAEAELFLPADRAWFCSPLTEGK